METKSIETLQQHLLYHKALAESPEEVERINGYLTTFSNAVEGNRMSDPVDEAIRCMFTMVLENGIDPWAIDLENFVKMYSEKVERNDFDMVIAGKFLLMAWKILCLQAKHSQDAIDPPEDFETFDEDFLTEDEDINMVPVPEMVFSKAFSRITIRKATLIELMDAFEEARQEQEIKDAQRETMEKLRQERKQAEQKFDNKAHEEDDETVMRRVYKTIIESSEKGPMTMKQFYNGNISDSISFFVSVLHLVKYGLLEIEQEALPSGTISIKIVDPKAEIPLQVKE